MVEQENPNHVQFLLSDFNTRLRDVDERTRLIRERVLLLGKNLIESRQGIEEEIKELKKENIELKTSLERVTKLSNNLIMEFNKFVKRDEMMVIERMLKDFQPLEFMRKKDVEEMLEKKAIKSRVKLPTKKLMKE